MPKARDILASLFIAAALICVTLGTANAQFPSIPGVGGSGGGTKVDGKGTEKKFNAEFKRQVLRR